MHLIDRAVLALAFPLVIGCSDDAAPVASNELQDAAPLPDTSPADDGGSAGSAGSGGSGAADGGLPIVPTPPSHVPAKNLQIREVSVFQGVKVTIAEDGAETDPASTVHVVAGREGLLRVYVEPSAAWSARDVTAELTLLRPGHDPIVLEATARVAGASEEDDLDSTLNVPIPKGAIETDTRYQLRLLTEPDQPEGDDSGAVFPPAGDASLFVWDTGPRFRVMLVPVELDGRIPDTSEEQLDLYRSELHALFPTREVELEVRDVYHHPGNVYAGGSGISSLLGSVTNLRQKDGAPDDVYYYGVFKAADTYDQYCSGGCTTGICHLVSSASDTYSRACVGVGFKGSASAGTMAHELGHAHGLPHAPCGGPAGPDSNYPYSNGKIGSWGWDLRDGTLVAPSTRDFMSYCSPSWISDYNFDRLIHRMSKIVQADAARIAKPPAPPSEWLSAEVGADGSVTWRETVTLRHPPEGAPRSIVYELGGVDQGQATAHFYPFSELPGGTLLVPARSRPWDALRVSGQRVVR